VLDKKGSVRRLFLMVDKIIHVRLIDAFNPIREDFLNR
jgi:hypothetical protein